MPGYDMTGFLKQLLEGAGGAAKNATPWGALLTAIPSLARGILGGIQAARGAKGFKRTMAARPGYEIPQEYKNILAQYQQARAGNMPGYDQQLSQIGQASARAWGRRKEGAISSNVLMDTDIYQKELDAIRGLGIKQEQYKSSMLDKVAGAQGILGGQKLAKQEWEELIPYQTELNRYGEMQKGGIENIFKGIQGMGMTASDLWGTKYLKDIYGNLKT